MPIIFIIINCMIRNIDQIKISSLYSRLSGMMEYWNIGMLDLKDWGNGVLGEWGKRQFVEFLTPLIKINQKRGKIS